ncbi:unnamed protein product [Bemisia tabaci]|uniref:Large ribosomal subunit protein mL52 n=1 Tax=Bemisia tabaci TaxID=7038 RepID=A0A9P0EZL1_BEMTA|nr:unnamed protein product [Bemisia tabaci]
MLVKHSFLSLSRGGLQAIPKYPISSSATLFAVRPKPPPSRLTVQPNQTKEFRDDPDFSYVDGRLAPYGMGQTIRIKQQIEFVKTICKYSKELDAVKAESAAKLKAEQDAIQHRLDRRLKPKGDKHPHTSTQDSS